MVDPLGRRGLHRRKPVAPGRESRSRHASDLATFDAKAEALFKKASAPQTARPPSDGPKAVKGKNIVIIPCSMAAEGCGRMARGAQEAAKLIGWQSTLIDPAGDTTKAADAVQRTINIKADGIILVGTDAKRIQGALQQAKEADIKIVAEGDNVNGIYDATMPSNRKEFFLGQGYLIGG
jgi:ribose transport system substrate-binding protein